MAKNLGIDLKLSIYVSIQLFSVASTVTMISAKDECSEMSEILRNLSQTK